MEHSSGEVNVRPELAEKQEPHVSHHDDIEASPSAVDEKKLVRKIDRRLLPILGCLYAVSLVDRGNMSFALVAGMMEDLSLNVGDRYSILVLVFFAFYVVFELPSNLVLPKAGPRNWLSFLGLSFGVVTIGMGFTRTWGHFLICRIFLGATEAGFLPGCTFLISVWYTRYEVGKRLASFWVLSVLANGFAGILAYGLTQMDGVQGLEGWRWIFIIEGCITCGIVVAAYLLIVDLPDKSEGFLKPHEKAAVIARINADRGDAESDAITKQKVLHHLKDWKLYAWMLLLFAAVVPGFSYNFFTPLILSQGMGFTRKQSLLMTAPPFVFAAIATYTSSWISDKYRLRGPVYVFHLTCCIAGMFITAYVKNPGARYFGVFLGLGMVQYCPMVVLAWQANNVTSTSKRAVASAITLIGSGLGGMCSGGAFKTSEAPLYQTGIYLSLGLYFLSLTIVAGMEYYFYKMNKEAREGKRKIEGMDDWYYTY
ncbi:uncharacterized protein HMPREF1541_08467 [Cyphellophora europaea CBS 101466]|uniref:Major facilitator superfamily (MFS) profile domain-containing protein n=1 Tax=Cyphellophora europaea (strain CBS 101466) TaxID=1220924 RepID=W2RIN3_CYPE1|nr:uncharacterized protein HMPREF1541_08467 [Cyphellophora europaea CBS 101466]ETN36190.1 hypothetical protein HMPREF1541_08467 [Cyphellophora europaea CBS 101466]